MTDIVHPEIDKYCENHTTPMADYFSALKMVTVEKTNAPQMQVGVIEGSFLKMLVALSNAKTVLEFGTFTGFSSLAMAEGLPADGKIITCDIDPKATAIAQDFWARSPHGKKIELRLGPGLETVAKMTEVIDMAFIDADKANYVNYWNAVIPKLRTGGLIVVDNVLWSGNVLNPQDKSDHHICALNEHALQDRRVQIVMLPVRDGMLLARKI